MSDESRSRLESIGALVRERFESEKRVLSFGEYLALFEAHPWRHTRDAARYLRDCVDHYGSYEVTRPGGSTRRWRLFDVEFDRPEDRSSAAHEYLVGQERLQGEFHRVLQNFVREGRVNRLVLLHGPNGSAKSTFVGCLMRALEHYSQSDDGALYRFSWIFPRGSDGKTVGFGSRDELPGEGESFAHLPDSRIDVKLMSELRESPLLLLPTAERAKLLADLYGEAQISDPPPRSLASGQLGHKNRAVFEALLTAYRGDLSRVLAHVRVERYYCSRRYRVGAVTVGPEMAVDAAERQISADRSLGSLPASLASLALYETVGELVHASGGVLEFSDLLKRPLDAWRYLLLAIETSEVSLTHSLLPLNSVLVATSNELHLNAFKEHHEYKSFRGRLQPVRVPYLLDYTLEQGIYDAQIVPQVRVHVAPHATFIAALWAVLTRLRQPQPEGYAHESLGKLAAQLTPIEKAELYAHQRIPERYSSDEAKDLRAGLGAIHSESDNWPIYEGLTGASPREVRNLLLDAAQDPAFDSLSPLAVLAHIQRLVKAGDHDFLKEKAEGGYHDHAGFLEVVRERWLDRVDEEFRESTGLVEEAQYLELFDRYVLHVSYWTKGERMENPHTGKSEDPDPQLMNNVEDMLAVDKSAREGFRHDLISTIAGHAIDNPEQRPDYARVFPRYLSKLREATYGKRKKQLAAVAEDVLRRLSDDERARSELDEEREALADRTQAALERDHGYVAPSVRDAVGELRARRYAS